MTDSTSMSAVSSLVGAGRAIVPVPRFPISIRVATLDPGSDDIPFIDSLQKKHRNEVGFMSFAQLRQYVERGCVLIAEGRQPQRHREHGEEREGCFGNQSAESEFRTSEPKSPSVSLCASVVNPLGYIIARDQYCKHDDVGIIYQLNVAPGSQRKLVGAALVQEVFRRAAYGCKMFCCWCAQDIAANRFWQSLGFRALAFRAGSNAKGRVHIFWIRRIVIDDAATPLWYPSLTSAGSIREDRIVLPIPEGVNWWDQMPRVVPQAMPACGPEALTPAPLPPPALGEGTKKKSKRDARQFATVRGGAVITDRKDARLNQPFFETAAQREERARIEEEAKKAKAAKREAREKRESGEKPSGRARFRPEHLAMARELRDRYLEQVNSGALALGASQPGGAKYEVGRVGEGAWEAGRITGEAVCQATLQPEPLPPAPLLLAAA